VDALEPFGFGHQLPRGLLREPLRSLARAEVIALSRADLVDAERRTEILSQLRSHAPEAICLEVAHRPQQLMGWQAEHDDLSFLEGRRVAAFCGIGNPDGFSRTLERLGCQLVAFRPFADHHAYQRGDIDVLTAWARDAEADVVLCTHKDLVKVQLDRLGQCPLRAVLVGIDFVSGQEDLEQRLEQLVN
jgi:tetraacyldisaccharide 4'-kinase